MYEHLIFTGVEHATMAQVAPDLKDRVLTVSGVSKTYAMTGWRIGFAGGPKPLIRAMVNMQGQATAGISTVGMAAAVAALEGPQDGAREQSVAYQRRRDIAVEMLNGCKGITCHKPEGAFYVFPNVAGCLGHTTAGGKELQNDRDVCLALLEEQYVATVHGAAYHMSPYLRVSTATDEPRWWKAASASPPSATGCTERVVVGERRACAMAQRCCHPGALRCRGPTCHCRHRPTCHCERSGSNLSTYLSLRAPRSHLPESTHVTHGSCFAALARAGNSCIDESPPATGPYPSRWRLCRSRPSHCLVVPRASNGDAVRARDASACALIPVRAVWW